jgi:cyclophilin family peptidyl-prolyl cis-trans isomerase
MYKYHWLLLLILGFVPKSISQKPPKKDYLININTPYGSMKAVLYHSTPQHRQNFLKLVNQKFYDSLLFHRVMAQFMIQGGDPNSKKALPGQPLGAGSNNYKIPAEFLPQLFHKKGALAAARDNNPEKASSGCQFYIVQGKIWKAGDLAEQMLRAGRQATEDQKNAYQSIGGSPHLDGNYTVFGEVISGLAVVDSIAAQKTDARNRPTQNIAMYISAQKVKTKIIYKKYGYKVGL